MAQREHGGAAGTRLGAATATAHDGSSFMAPSRLDPGRPGTSPGTSPGTTSECKDIGVGLTGRRLPHSLTHRAACEHGLLKASLQTPPPPLRLGSFLRRSVVVVVVGEAWTPV